jgi:CHASE3 domain sensor protein
MKTNIFFLKKSSFLFVVGCLSTLFYSCGSYQNSSYYDNDGIYADQQNRTAQPVQKSSNNNQYKEYFSSLNQEAQEVFTDVESYSSVQPEQTTNQTENSISYSSWGNNPQNVTVNVYDNNGGLANWNNYWYGNYWGWNNCG